MQQRSSSNDAIYIDGECQLGRAYGVTRSSLVCVCASAVALLTTCAFFARGVDENKTAIVVRLWRARSERRCNPVDMQCENGERKQQHGIVGVSSRSEVGDAQHSASSLSAFQLSSESSWLLPLLCSQRSAIIILQTLGIPQSNSEELHIGTPTYHTQKVIAAKQKR